MKNKGFAAFIIIVIVAAATFLMAYSSALLGLGELDMGYNAERGSEALSIADGCLEEALRQFRLNSGYNGGAITFGNGSCIIGVLVSGSDRTITVNASTTNLYYKKIEANITLTGAIRPTIVLNSWKEKND